MSSRDFIPEFSGMTRAQFDAVTLENEGRRAVLVSADSARHPEYAVQLVGAILASRPLFELDGTLFLDEIAGRHPI